MFVESSRHQPPPLLHPPPPLPQMKRFKGYLQTGEGYLRGQVSVTGVIVSKERLRVDMQRRHDEAIKRKRLRKASSVADSWIGDIRR